MATICLSWLGKGQRGKLLLYVIVCKHVAIPAARFRMCKISTILGRNTLWDVELQYIFSCRVPECHFDVAQLFIQAHISCTGFHRNTPCCQASCFSHHKLTCFCLVGTLTILSFRGRALELVGVFNISPTLSQQEWNITIFFL